MPYKYKEIIHSVRCLWIFCRPVRLVVRSVARQRGDVSRKLRGEDLDFLSGGVRDHWSAAAVAGVRGHQSFQHFTWQETGSWLLSLTSSFIKKPMCVSVSADGVPRGQRSGSDSWTEGSIRFYISVIMERLKTHERSAGCSSLIKRQNKMKYMKPFLQLNNLSEQMCVFYICWLCFIEHQPADPGTANKLTFQYKPVWVPEETHSSSFTFYSPNNLSISGFIDNENNHQSAALPQINAFVSQSTRFKKSELHFPEFHSSWFHAAFKCWRKV